MIREAATVLIAGLICFVGFVAFCVLLFALAAPVPVTVP